MQADSANGALSSDQAPVYRWNPRIACRTLSETAFLLLDGRMLSLNAVGTRMWDLFRDGATVAKVAQTIVAEYETTNDVALRDTQAFVSKLNDGDLLVVSPSESTMTYSDNG